MKLLLLSQSDFSLPGQMPVALGMFLIIAGVLGAIVIGPFNHLLEFVLKKTTSLFFKIQENNQKNHQQLSDAFSTYCIQDSIISLVSFNPAL